MVRPLLLALGVLVVIPTAITQAADAVSLRIAYSQTGLGQFGEFDFRPDESLFLPVPREQSIRIERIRTAAEDKRWTDAAQELASILSDSEYEDYVTRSEVGKPANESLKAYISGMMAELPNSVWDAYQLLVGAEARAILDEGLKSQDPEKLGEVIRRYLHTKAGEKATIILARLLMDRRQWEGAYLLLSKLEDIRPNRRDLVMESEVLKIVCRASSGDRKSALQDLESFLDQHGAQNRLLPEIPNDKMGWQPEKLLDQLVRIHTSLGQKPFTWMLFQGDATRNAQSRGSEPLREVMWNVRLAHSRQEQERIQKAKQRLLDNQLPVIPAIQPLVVQDQVIFRTPNSLLATDVRSGKILWKFPWDSLDSETNDPPTADPAFNADGSGDLLEYAIWADSARGHLSSDGERVFFVHEDPVANGSALRVGNANFMMRATRQMKQNSLMSLDINREGATVWMLGNSEEDNGEGLSGARFLGPPLPVDGQLFALARIIDETRLLSLDPETGSVLWSQQLSHSPAQQDLTTDFSLAASPSYHGGILICPTNAGVLVAIDTVSRTILWGYQYKEIEQARNNRRITINSRTNNQDESLFGNRWTDGTPVIYGSHVLVTPPDSDELLCLDLLTGKQRWTRPRDNGLTIACVEGGILLQINSDSLLGIDVATGEPAWRGGETSLPEGTAPGGYGFRREGTYFLPTTKETILPIDIKSGEFGQPISSGGELGNLVCYDQFVLAVSPEYVTAFKQIDALRREVEQRLANNSDDAEALRHQGSLRLHDGNLTEALASLQRSYELDQVDETRHALVSTGLAALRADFDDHQNLIPQLESLVETAEDQLLLARLKATGRHRQGKTLEAFEAYLEFADLAEVLHGDDQTAEELHLDSLEPDLKAHHSRVLRGYMVELAPTAEDAELEKIESTLQARLDEIASGEADEVERLHRFATHFHPFDVSREARIRRTARLLKDGRLLEGEIALRGLFVDQVPAQDKARLILALAELCETEQMPKQATKWFELLAEQFSDIAVRGNQSVSEVLAEKTGDGRTGSGAMAQSRWGYRDYTVRSEQHTPIITRQNYSIRLRELNQVVQSGFGIRLDNQSNQFLVNDSSGELTVRIPFNTESGKQLYNPQIGAVYAEQLGHLLAISLGDEIQVFDTLPRPAGSSEERLLWSVQLQNEVPGSRGRTARITAKSGENPFGERVTKANDGGKPIGQFSLTAHGTMVYQLGAKVVCVDPLNGEILWQRDRTPIGSQLICSERYVVTIPPGRSNSAGPDVRALVFSIDNGTLVREIDLPDPLRIWTDHEGILVCWKESSLPDNNDRTYEIQGIDAETGEMVWQRQPANGSQAALLNQRNQLAILQPSGKFEVLNLADGKSHFTDQLESGTLQRVKILEGFGELFLVAYRPFEADRRLQFRCVPHDSSESVLRGEVYAFNAQTGDRLWNEPARVSETYFVESLQPIELPVLTFVARLNRPIEGSAQSKPMLSALILDRRDGRILFRGEFGESSLSYVVSGEPEKGQITLRFDSQSILLTANDDPRAPAPPAANSMNFTFPPESAPSIE
ncbi:MAG: PQQ-binding-like beta-propeller repeat protein [Pirellulaceae bacterium]